MTVRDHHGDPVEPADVLSPEELAVYAAQHGDRRYAWALTGGRCTDCGAVVRVDERLCMACLPSPQALVEQLAALQADCHRQT